MASFKLRNLFNLGSYSSNSQATSPKKHQHLSVRSNTTPLQNIQNQKNLPISQLKQFKRLWKEFNHFYVSIIIENNEKKIRQITKKYKNVLQCPQLSHNLNEMIKILRMEDRENRFTKTIGDCLEYVIRKKIIEFLVAYAMTDNPHGFFGFTLNIISELLSSITSTSILSQSSIHPPINQLLRCIYEQLIAVNISSYFSPNQIKNSPGKQAMIEEIMHETYVLGNALEILEFINTLAFKVTEEPYLVKVFFSGQSSNIVGGGHQERICLPFQILVYYFKNQNVLLSNSERAFLRDIILVSFGCMSKDQFFAEYLANESDFIEIFIQNIASQLESMPIPIQINGDSSIPWTYHRLCVIEQLERNYNRMMVEQFKELMATCTFFKDILKHIYNDSQLFPQSPRQKFFFDPENKNQLFERHVKESFLLSFTTMILKNIAQPIFLEPIKSSLDKQRTILQYLIEIMVILQDQCVCKLILSFLLNKMENMMISSDDQNKKFQQQNNLCLQLEKENESIFFEEKNNNNNNIQLVQQIISDGVITDTCNYYQEESPTNGGMQVAVVQDGGISNEHEIDYENNNKKKSSVGFEDQWKVLKKILKKGEGGGSFTEPLSDRIKSRNLMGSVLCQSRNDIISNKRRVISGYNLMQSPSKTYDDISPTRKKNTEIIEEKNEVLMTLSRMRRIDTLFKEAEHIENIKSEMGDETQTNYQDETVIYKQIDSVEVEEEEKNKAPQFVDSQNIVVGHRFEQIIQGYKGQEIFEKSLQLMTISLQGMCLTFLNMINTSMKIGGSSGCKQFVKDFILDDLKIVLNQRFCYTVLQTNECYSLRSLNSEELNNAHKIVQVLMEKETNQYLHHLKDVRINCENVFFKQLLHLFIQFFANKPKENNILSNIISTLFADIELILDDSTFPFVMYTLQYGNTVLQQPFLLDVLFHLQEEARNLQQDQQLVDIKNSILLGFCDLESEDNYKELKNIKGYQEEDPNEVLAQNLIILDRLIYNVSKALSQKSFALNMIYTYKKSTLEDKKLNKLISNQ